MLYVRPVALSDQDELLLLAKEAGIGMTSLPPDGNVLRSKIAHSVSSCARKCDAEDEYFLFVMVDSETNKLVGTAGVDAHVGIKKPFYSYKLSSIVQASSELGVYTRNQVLHMVNDYTHATEIGSLFLLPPYRKNGNGRFMSRFRYLMLAEFPDMFSNIVISEIRGVQDDDGQSPFYKNLAQHFFQMDFKKADFHHATQGGQFISDLMPRYPIYVKLLDARAQSVIGVPFAASLPAKNLLEKEGFRYQGYVDVFDAGPTMEVERSAIRSVRKSRNATVNIIDSVEQGELCMIATTQLPGFYGTRAEAMIQDDVITIGAEAADVLRVKSGDRVRYLEMNV